MPRVIPRRAVTAAALLILVVGVGTAGYALIEGYTPFEALYMTVTTISTVGFGEIRPLTDAGRAFTIGLIIGGVGVLFYALSSAAAFLLEGRLAAILGVRRMRGKIERLSNHYILCGFGRVGREIAREFVERKIPFVVVDHNPEALTVATEAGYLVHEGDATRDEILRAAGIERARGLIAAGDSDATNTYVTLSAKSLNPRLFVIARAGTPEIEAKLRRAGADRVVSPYTLAGRRMALAATQPFMIDFVDALPQGRHGVILAELEVKPDGPLAGRSLSEALVLPSPRGPARGASLRVLAVQHADGSVSVAPPSDTRLGVGDQVVVLGDEADVHALGSASA
jgi:voltage-gated potassium channel